MKKLQIILLLLLLSVYANAQLLENHELLKGPSIGNITFFGVASAHTDNSGYTTDPSTLTPPPSMLAGDLVILISSCRETTPYAPAINNGGGQAWSSLAISGGAPAVSSKVFYCTFNGTWSANPSINNNSTATCRDLQMIAFRPTTSIGVNWVVHVASTRTEWIQDTVNPIVASESGQAVARPSVQICFWHKSTSNGTISTLTGTGWTQAGSQQYRNPSGVSKTIAYAYNIRQGQGSAISTSKSITAGTNNQGYSYMVTFAENY
jgi:hypothetical protein